MGREIRMERERAKEMIKLKPWKRQFFKVIKIGETPKLNAVPFWATKKTTGFEPQEKTDGEA